MATYHDLDRDGKLLVNRLYSAASEALFPKNTMLKLSSDASSRLMQAMVDEVAEIVKLNDPEYHEFLRLQKKFPNG